MPEVHPDPDDLLRGLAGATSCYPILGEMIGDAVAEIERLRADARRLDWLEAHDPKVRRVEWEGRDMRWCAWRRGTPSASFGPTLRAAIDAAMKGG